MHDYKVGTFPILAEKLKDVKIEEKKPNKSRKVLSKEDRELLKEAIAAGGKNAVIAKRFDVSEATVTNIRRDMRRDKLTAHVEAQPRVTQEVKPKHITDAVSEVYRSLETLQEDDKLKVLLSVGYLYGFTPGLS